MLQIFAATAALAFSAMPVPPSPSDPFALLSTANLQADTSGTHAQLYRLALRPSVSESCVAWGWRYDYFVPAPQGADPSAARLIEVDLDYVPGNANFCHWQWTTTEKFGETPTWGTSPVSPEPGRYLTPEKALAAARAYFHHEFELTSVDITKPAIDNAPTFTYLVTGKLCGGETYLVLRGDDGAIFDAPERPSCPD